jgi:hypothetical protein
MAKKIDINKALKGEVTKLPEIDFSSPENKKYLKRVKAECDAILKNKDSNWQRIGSFVIGK